MHQDSAGGKQAEPERTSHRQNKNGAEPSELIYFKIYKSQAPVTEQAVDTAALMLGSDKSRGYCLEMICADFLAGAHAENGNPKILLLAMLRLFRFLSTAQRQEFLEAAAEARVKTCPAKHGQIRLDADAYRGLHQQILERDGWRCQACGSLRGLEVHHIRHRSRLRDASEGNLIALCSNCHRALHRYLTSSSLRSRTSHVIQCVKRIQAELPETVRRGGCETMNSRLPQKNAGFGRRVLRNRSQYSPPARHPEC